jgi:hypothetical protein
VDLTTGPGVSGNQQAQDLVTASSGLGHTMEPLGHQFFDVL